MTYQMINIEVLPGTFQIAHIDMDLIKEQCQNIAYIFSKYFSAFNAEKKYEYEYLKRCVQLNVKGLPRTDDVAQKLAKSLLQKEKMNTLLEGFLKMVFIFFTQRNYCVTQKLRACTQKTVPFTGIMHQKSIKRALLKEN